VSVASLNTRLPLCESTCETEVFMRRITLSMLLDGAGLPTGVAAGTRTTRTNERIDPPPPAEHFA